MRLPMSMKQFHQLPRNPAYKYEYFDDHAVLTPRPKGFNAILHLKPAEAPAVLALSENVRIRGLHEQDWEALVKLFAWAFERVQPFASLGDKDRLKAARECLEQTRTGGDGPLMESASFVAASETEDHPLGAILITLIPKRNLGQWWDGRWTDPPPPDAVQRRLGRPHLTWVFVNPWVMYHGLGSLLLAHAGNALLALGYTEMASTFLVGNDSSVLWHWRNDFQLAPYAGSPRVIQARRQAALG